MQRTFTILLVTGVLLALALCLGNVAMAQTTATGTVASSANLRAGPGTTFAIVGSVAPGTIVQLVGRNQDSDWYQLKTGTWIFAKLVTGAPKNLPVVSPTLRGLPTPTPQVKTKPTPPPTPVQPPGFGSPLTAWRATYGQPTKAYGYEKYGVWEVLPLPGGIVQHMERIYDPAVTRAKAWGDVTALLPKDSELVDTYSPPGRSEVIVDVYSSAELLAALPDSAWQGGTPGEFIVIYNQAAKGINRVVIAAGNNP